MSLAIYDMDKTITRKASWTSWLLFYAKREAPWRLALVPLMAIPSLGFLLGLTDRKGLKQATQTLLMGRFVPRGKIEAAAQAFADSFGAQQEMQGALASIAADRAAGRDVWLATASCRFFVEALAKRWGIETVIATENRWKGDYLTPEILGENCYDMGKLRKILAKLDKRPDNVRFYSDHVSDLPVLDWADVPFAVNPSTKLRKLAQKRGWQIFSW